MSSSLWVQLYYEHDERVEMQDNLVDIGLADIPNGNISGLVRRLKENDMKNDLSHCDRRRIRVYPHGTTPPFLQDKAIDPGDNVPTGTTSKNPLIVPARNTWMPPKLSHHNTAIDPEKESMRERILALEMQDSPGATLPQRQENLPMLISDDKQQGLISTDRARRQSINDRISDSLKEFFQGTELKRPSLPKFKPKEDALLGPLMKEDGPGLSSVPSNPNEPFLLFHDLESVEGTETKAYKYIGNTRGKGPTALYGTSGAGKTRTVLKYLSHQKGLYLVSKPSSRDPGSRDLLSIFALLEESKNTVSISNRNLQKVFERLRVLLYVRKAVHDYVTEQLGDISAYEWLLLQLFPKDFLGDDIFHIATADGIFGCRFDDERSSSDLKNGLPLWKHTFVDEAQQLLDEGHWYFLSENGNETRSNFSALLKAFSEIRSANPRVGYPVFVGTGLEDLHDGEPKSTVAKRRVEWYHEVFQGFQPLTPSGVERYLGTFLDLSKVDNKKIMDHVCNWLRGRPRFTATFLEEFLVRKGKVEHARGTEHEAALIQALDRYLLDMTEAPKTLWISGSETTAYCQIARMVEKNRALGNVLENAFFQFSLNGMPVLLENETKNLMIQSGVAALFAEERESDAEVGMGEEYVAVIDEPIVVQAGIHCFELEKVLERHLEMKAGKAVAKDPEIPYSVSTERKEDEISRLMEGHSSLQLEEERSSQQ